MKILLVDDHPLFLEGITNLLEANGHQVLGTAGDGIEALAMARKLQPELILMDIQMGRCDGLTAIKLIKSELPEIKIVVLSMSDQNEHLFAAIAGGASGYLQKQMDSEYFLSELEKAARGENPMASGMTSRVFQHFAEISRGKEEAGEGVNSADTIRQTAALTGRQKQIISLISTGYTYKETGEILGVSESTVKSHMKNIFTELNFQNKAEVIAFAVKAGLAG